MKSMRLDAFLSCSFDPADKEVVGFFASLCRGVGIVRVNVDKAYVSTPPDKARELIQNSHLLIAVATRRTEIKPGVYAIQRKPLHGIPKSVTPRHAHQEVSRHRVAPRRCS